MTSHTIDLNSDLGEGFGVWSLGDDAAMLEIVSSANVACGFHAGDPTIMRAVCERAATLGVAVGAQVSYLDVAGFGRRFIDVQPTELTNGILYQIGALQAIARAAGTHVTYVKPHGALYNAIVSHEQQAQAVIDALTALNDPLPIMGLAGSEFLARAEQHGITVVPEGFADRAYNVDGTLVPRSRTAAVITDPHEISQRVLDMVLRHCVMAISGETIEMHCSSICVHGDTPGAVEIARTVRVALEREKVTIASI